MISSIVDRSFHNLCATQIMAYAKTAGQEELADIVRTTAEKILETDTRSGKDFREYLIRHPSSVNSHLHFFHLIVEKLGFLLVSEKSVQKMEKVFQECKSADYSTIKSMIDQKDETVMKIWLGYALRHLCRPDLSCLLEMNFLLEHMADDLKIRMFQDLLFEALSEGVYGDKGKIVQCIISRMDPNIAATCVYSKNAQGEIFLRKAASQGDVEIIDIILKQLPYSEVPASVFEADEKGNTIMHLAAKSGNGSVIDVLANAFPDVLESLLVQNKKGRTPLHLAVLHGDCHVVNKLLLWHKGSDICVQDVSGVTPLHIAAIGENRDARTFKILLEFLPKEMVMHGLLIRDVWDRQPLHIAVRKGHFNAVNEIIDVCGLHGLDLSPLYEPLPNSGQTLCHLAVQKPWAREMIALIVKACPTELLKRELFGQDHQGFTPLHLMARKGLAYGYEFDALLNGNLEWCMDSLFARDIFQCTPWHYLKDPLIILNFLCLQKKMKLDPIQAVKCEVLKLSRSNKMNDVKMILEKWMDSDLRGLYIEEALHDQTLVHMLLDDHHDKIIEYMNAQGGGGNLSHEHKIALLPLLPGSVIRSIALNIEEEVKAGILNHEIQLENQSIPLLDAVQLVHQEWIAHINWDGSGGSNALIDSAARFISSLPLFHLVVIAVAPKLQDTIVSFAPLFNEVQAALVIPVLTTSNFQVLMETLGDPIRQGFCLRFATPEQKNLFLLNMESFFSQLDEWKRVEIFFQLLLNQLQQEKDPKKNDQQINDLKKKFSLYSGCLHRLEIMRSQVKIFFKNIASNEMTPELNIQTEEKKQKILEEVQRLQVNLTCLHEKIFNLTTAAEKTDAIPENFIDPITANIMNNPVYHDCHEARFNDKTIHTICKDDTKPFLHPFKCTEVYLNEFKLDHELQNQIENFKKNAREPLNMSQ